MVDKLISNLEKFKALKEFKGNLYDGDRKEQYTVLRRELCKKHEGFGPEELPKIANDTHQTGKQKPFQYSSCSAGTFLSI